MKGKWIFYVGLVSVSSIWGVNYAFTRWILESFDPILYTFIRFILALPIFFTILKLREGSIMIEAKDIGKIIIVGFLGVTVLEISSVYSIKLTTLTNAALLSTAPWPIFVALFSLLFNKETITARLLIGGGAAIVGVCFIILGGNGGINLSSHLMLGNMLALNVSIVGALFSLFSISLMKRYSPLRITSWFILFGVIFMFPFTLGSWEQVNWAALTPQTYWAYIYNVLFCTIIGFVMWNLCMNRIGATKSSFFRYITPVMAAVNGYVMYKETSGSLQIIGALIICFGLVWINSGKIPANTLVKADANV